MANFFSNIWTAVKTAYKTHVWLKWASIGAAVAVAGGTTVAVVSNSNNVHQHQYEQIVTAPTCVEQGFTTNTCACGDSFIDTYVNALGHNFMNYVTNNDATCTEDGTETATCNHEGCEETNTRVDEGSALGHDFTNYVTNNDATCTEDGTEIATCNHEGCEETNTRVDEGSALGHEAPDELNICNKCKQYHPIEMSEDERELANQVEVLSYNANYSREDAAFSICFGLKNASDKLIKAPVCISYFITDFSDEVVYKGYNIFYSEDYAEDTYIYLELLETDLGMNIGSCKEIYYQIHNFGYYQFNTCTYSRLWNYDDLEYLSGLAQSASNYLSKAEDYYWEGLFDFSSWGDMYSEWAVDYTEKALPYLEAMKLFADGKVDLEPYADSVDYSSIQEMINTLYNTCITIVDQGEYDISASLNASLLVLDISMITLEYLENI